MKLRYTEQADLDLDRLLAETAARWPGSLHKTTRRLRAFEQALSQFPKIGARTRFAGIRKHLLAPLPYAAFYRVAADEIVILRIYHTARRPFGPKII